jgi:tetratricopeptide (TPR) repeat protein
MTFPAGTRLAGALLLITLSWSVVVHGQDSVLGISERVFKTMDDAQALLDAKDLDGAREALEATLERRISNYERAQLLNMLGYTWYEKDDLERARSTYREALALEDLPDSMLITLNLTLGQVYLIDEYYAEAEEHLRRLLAFENQDTPSNRVLLVATLLGQERYEDALEPLRSAIAEVEASGEAPRENWLSMLSSIYYEMDDMQNMREVVEKLTVLYPREQYLMNLAALHGQLGDEERQLALAEALLDDGRITRPPQISLLVNLFLGAGLPHKAATLLERELQRGRLERDVANLELLSQAWYMSADVDRAIEPLAGAAELSDDGDLYLRLARLHMDAGRWDAADGAAAAALEKGGLREEGQAWLLRGMADVRLHRFVEARRRFEKAADFEETQRYADQWLAFVEVEEARTASSN